MFTAAVRRGCGPSCTRLGNGRKQISSSAFGSYRCGSAETRAVDRLETTNVIRKILVAFLLVGSVAIAATALSQNPAGTGPSLTPATPTPPSSKPAVDKAAPAPSAAAKTG